MTSGPSRAAWGRAFRRAAGGAPAETLRGRVSGVLWSGRAKLTIISEAMVLLGITTTLEVRSRIRVSRQLVSRTTPSWAPILTQSPRLNDLVRFSEIPARTLLRTPWRAKPIMAVKMAEVARKGGMLTPRAPLQTANQKIRQSTMGINP